MSAVALPRKMGLIVAMDIDNGIAKNGKIPWRIRRDVEFFKSVTSKTENPEKRNVVLMGRKCWESIPEKFRPLKDRLNIVISRTMEPQESPDLIVSNDFDDVLRKLSSAPLAQEIETVWNIGGTEIYRLALEKDLVDKLIVTKIDKRYDADLIINVDWSKYAEVEEKREEHNDDGVPFSFHVYERNNAIKVASS